MPRYRFFIRGNADATEVVAESFDLEGDIHVFRDVREEDGEQREIAELRTRVDGEVETIG